MTSGPARVLEALRRADGRTCSGETLSPGDRCSVDLVFAPSTEGELSVQLVASLDSGAEVAATISGVGAPPPTLEIIPGVATVGQVVTVSGGGFPAGAAVDMTFAGLEREVVVNDVGVFNVPLVVMRNTNPGPLAASVAAQVDVFGPVETTMLVTRTTSRSNPAILSGVGPSVAR